MLLCLLIGIHLSGRMSSYEPPPLTIDLIEVVSSVVVTLTSFEPWLAVRTFVGGSRAHYPFCRNTFGIQFVESEHFWIFQERKIAGY